MDWKTFFVEILSSTIWPLTIVALAYVFKGPIVNLMSRIRKVRHKDTELLMEQFIEGTASKDSTNREKLYDPERQESEDFHTFLLRLAEDAPNLAIMEAWNIVQNEAQDAIARAPKDITTHCISTMDQWVSSELLSPENLNKYRRLETIRNILNHENSLQLSKKAVATYIRMAIEVSYALRNRYPKS